MAVGPSAAVSALVKMLPKSMICLSADALGSAEDALRPDQEDEDEDDERSLHERTLRSRIEMKGPVP